ncbi:glutathione hydrolase 5 proenzyme isoform X10 [Homo sapiens]|uniref:glutathione hydrolase 5 proenzyme isoform X10 n=1 Tax=Homo sapiens TaxID=9606 RepID=UPI0007DC5C95|nr:glutathione hydrolase 5 proenzyme isoform X10 [Homo sapiens]XP_054181511.1 glutathione hydrolase 5 proenzyme isoform X10 [Homo sapiens]|eukprot:XP_016884258.1 glutathione hydrolase 5 proenzyme isoform X8 [Homo sapiens]
MARGYGATVSLVLLGLGLALAVIVLAVVLSRHQAPCGPQAFAHAAVAADSKVCSDIGRAILQQQGSPVDATIAALVCTSVVNPQSMGLGGGVIFTIYNVTTGAQWIGVPGELRGYAEAHRRHGRLPWAQLFQPTIALLRGGHVVAPVLSRFLHNSILRPSLQASTLRQLFFNGTEPLRPQDPLPWPALATTLETVATEGVEVFYTGRLGQMLVEDIAKEGSQLTLQDLAKFQPEVVDALEVPLGDYTLYSPPPPAGGAILSFILNVLRGFNFSTESMARPEGRVNVYHHLVETLKFAKGQRWRLGDPRSHPKLQNASRDLLGETLAQLIRQQIDGRGDHQLSHYSLAEAWGHGTGTSHVSVLGEDGSAVAATSTINTPFGAMVYSPRTGIILNNELLDLCERCPRGSGTTPSPDAVCSAVSGDRVGGAPGRCWPPVPGERSPSSMVPSILINKAQGSKLVIGGAGGELIISAVAQAIMSKLWLGFDLRAAIAAPILHVNSKGCVEYEPNFSQEVQRGLQDRGQNQTQRPFFLNVVQAVSQEGACVYAVSDLRKSGEAAGY